MGAARPGGKWREQTNQGLPWSGREQAGRWAVPGPWAGSRSSPLQNQQPCPGTLRALHAPSSSMRPESSVCIQLNPEFQGSPGRQQESNLTNEKIRHTWPYPEKPRALKHSQERKAGSLSSQNCGAQKPSIPRCGILPGDRPSQQLGFPSNAVTLVTDASGARTCARTGAAFQEPAEQGWVLFSRQKSKGPKDCVINRGSSCGNTCSKPLHWYRRTLSRGLTVIHGYFLANYENYHFIMRILKSRIENSISRMSLIYRINTRQSQKEIYELLVRYRPGHRNIPSLYFSISYALSVRIPCHYSYKHQRNKGNIFTPKKVTDLNHIPEGNLQLHSGTRNVNSNPGSAR